MADSIIKDKSYAFALRVITLCAHLKENRHFEISRQLLRSGTSIGANVEEALAGQSRKDFRAKMSLASKEARETNYWLRLTKDSGILDGRDLPELIADSEELIKILTSIVKTSSTAAPGQKETHNSKLKPGPPNSKLKTKNYEPIPPNSKLKTQN